MATANSDRNLLFGILALQTAFIGRDALVKAMHAWVMDKAKPLGQILVEQQALGSERRTLLEALVQEHVKLHDGDLGKSLAALSSVGSAHEELKQITDPDIQASLARVPADPSTAADPYATDSYGTGSYADPYATDPFVPAPDAAAPPASVGAPSVVGRRFRILRPHARGGLGEVFVAHDEELHREVALKEIQERHADHPESRARFLVEAEITGGLEHPGIVPVYGLGQYADGRPFYAMRFIRGDSLKDAIERFHASSAAMNPGQRALHLRQLLGRFVDVCDAIGYAHSRGVLHRDLKPGNVMLGKYGETLVVDWGLAKPVGGPEDKTGETEGPLQPSSSGSAPTQMGSAIGTPAFMPPEQAAGRLDQLGPASDVYSLGATLYCLLTGKAPFESADVGTVLQKVQRGDFPPPRQVSRETPPALEAVCLKAMALRQGDRYPTPRALAGDIESWLADEPVSAWREPWRVRLGRWARRNQTMVAAVVAGVLVAILAGGAGALWYQHDQSVRAAERAQRAANTERDVTAALEEAAALGKQAETQKDDPAKWGAALTTALSAVKRADGVLNSGEGTDDLRKRVLAQGEDLAAADKDRRMIDGLEAARFQLSAAGDEGAEDKVGAARLYREAFQQDDQDWDSLPPVEAAARIKPRAIRDDMLAALADWSNITANKQDKEKLRAVLQVADPDPASLRNRWNAAAERKDLEALRRLAASREAEDQPRARLVLFADTLTELGATREAVQLLKEANERHSGDFWIAFKLAFAYLATNPPATDEAIRYYTAALMLRPDSAPARNNLGLALYDNHKLDEAIVEYRKALHIQPDLAVVHNNLGLALHGKGQLDEAISEYRKAIALKPDDAKVHNTLGAALSATGRRDEAVAEYRRALQIQPNNAMAHNNLGAALYDTSRWDEAIAEYRKALQIQPDNAVVHNNLGKALNSKGQLDEAIAEFGKALQILPDYADGHINLGKALFDKHQLDDAIAEYRKAVVLKPDDANSHYSLGLALQAKGKLDEAVAECRKAVELAPDDATAHNNLGVVLNAKGQWDESVAEFHKAEALRPDDVKAHYLLGSAFGAKGRLDEMVAEFRKAVALKPDDAEAHINLAAALGAAFGAKGQWDEAIAEFRKAVALKPDDAKAHNMLGVTLGFKGQPDEAIAEYRIVVALKPDDADAHVTLGNALYGRRQLDEAIAEYRKAVALRPDDAMIHFNLAAALRDKGQLDEAIAENQKTVELKPDFTSGWFNLGFALRNRGRFTESLAALRRCHELGTRSPKWSYPSADWVREAEQWVLLDALAPTLLMGAAEPESPAAGLRFAQLCLYKRQYGAAVTFYTKAFAAKPALADDLGAGARYNAACAAALAGCGMGEHAAATDDPTRTRCRKQARDWLRADLALWTKKIDSGDPQDRAAARKTLQHWQEDSDLAGVRDQGALAKLPADEQDAWRKLWADVDALRKKVQEK